VIKKGFDSRNTLNFGRDNILNVRYDDLIERPNPIVSVQTASDIHEGQVVAVPTKSAKKNIVMFAAVGGTGIALIAIIAIIVFVCLGWKREGETDDEDALRYDIVPGHN
jgi:hypothetical protein